MKRWLIVFCGILVVLTATGCSHRKPASVPSLSGSYSFQTPRAEAGNESYSEIAENDFQEVARRPLSTFSVDVDRASYSNVRRFIIDNQLPPKNAVRIEELINYFAYEYPEPEDRHPIALTSEVARCPWNDTHHLVQIGLQTKRISNEDLPPAQLVFLLDISGSMMAANKLPLLKSALFMLVEQLRPVDRVAIVTYAGKAGLALASTGGRQKHAIFQAIERLEAGGSTAGSKGILLAYQIAEENFIEDGINRVILATDGDFNVGLTSEQDLVRLVEQKRRSGVFLSVLGFGTGNLKDSRMEQLADNGNGQYAYIDNLLEARKVLVSEMGGTLLTVAKDVKIQVEFNPATIKAYRLIGYENRLLCDRDFNDDRKDAGDIGAGHSVTALYEVIPAGAGGGGLDPLKYQPNHEPVDLTYGSELMTVKCQYKCPSDLRSDRIEHVVVNSVVAAAQTSNNFRLAAAAAEFGLLLRESDYRAQASYQQAYDLARSAVGEDEHGLRSEFARLVQAAGLMHGSLAER